MPPHTRSQRRRQVVQQKGRSAPPSAEKGRSAPPSVETELPAPLSVEALSPPAVTSATIPLPSAQAASQRPARQARRAVSRSVPAPVDYTGDYVAVRRDLRWILLWSALLFVGMIALRFSGLV